MLWNAILEQADLPKVIDQAKEVSSELLKWVDKGYEVVTLMQVAD